MSEREWVGPGARPSWNITVNAQDPEKIAQTVRAVHKQSVSLKSEVYHRDGVPWYEAPIPPRFHRCQPQTSSGGMGVVRCACGAIASIFGPWMEKNSRRGPWWRFGR